MAEEWRAIAGFEGYYEVSSLGKIRSLDRIVHNAPGLKQFSRRYSGRELPVQYAPAARGYGQAGFNRDGKRVIKLVHILVCEAFHGPRPPGHVAAHWDGDKGNNSAANLRWATYAENCADMDRHGRRRRGEDHQNTKFSTAEVLAMRRRYRFREVGLRTVAKEFGVSQTQLRRILAGESRLAG